MRASVRRPRPPFGLWAGGALLFLLAAGLGWFVGSSMSVFGMFSPGSMRPRSFDAASWNDPDWEDSMVPATNHHSIRQRMVDDLLARHLRLGMSEDEVLALIGPKDEDPYFRDPTDREAWVYVLGAERGFIGIDNEWLFVSFDGERRVRRAYLATD